MLLVEANAMYSYIHSHANTHEHMHAHIHFTHTHILMFYPQRWGQQAVGKLNLWLPKNLKVWPSILAEVVMILFVSYHFAANIKDNDKPEVQSKCTCTLSTSSTPM